MRTTFKIQKGDKRSPRRDDEFVCFVAHEILSKHKATYQVRRPFVGISRKNIRGACISTTTSSSISSSTTSHLVSHPSASCNCRRCLLKLPPRSPHPLPPRLPPQRPVSSRLSRVEGPLCSSLKFLTLSRPSRSCLRPAAAKKTSTPKKASAPADSDKKKRKKVRKETYSSYIYKGTSTRHLCPVDLTLMVSTMICTFSPQAGPSRYWYLEQGYGYFELVRERYFRAYRHRGF